jgi:hypothetical protein
MRSAFGGLFPSFPEVSLPTETVRFRRKDVGQSGVDQFVVVSASGLIEATVPITPSVNDTGELLVPVVEIARALLPAIRAIQDGGYEQIFGPGAAIPLGLDWEIKLSRELVGQPSTPWAGLVFPSRAPDGRGTDQRPPWPRPGFGHERLQCVESTIAPRDILTPALEDLVERSGYYGTNEAINDLRAAVRQLDVQTPEPPPATPGGPYDADPQHAGALVRDHRRQSGPDSGRGWVKVAPVPAKASEPDVHRDVLRRSWRPSR